MVREKTDTESKQNMVYEQIREAMWSRKYPPGAILSERKLSEDFGVSRSPVREALKRFVGEGLLDQTGSNRVIVPDVTRDEICEVCDLLELLEPYAARRCAERMTQEAAERFRVTLEHMKRACEDDRRWDYIRSELDFHSLIMYNSGVRRALNSLRSVWSQRMRIISSFDMDPETIQKSFCWNERICRSITGKDALDTERQVRAYVYWLRDRFLILTDEKAAE